MLPYRLTGLKISAQDGFLIHSVEGALQDASLAMRQAPCSRERFSWRLLIEYRSSASRFTRSGSQRSSQASEDVTATRATPPYRP